jgi:hypothetical protein
VRGSAGIHALYDLARSARALAVILLASALAGCQSGIPKPQAGDAAAGATDFTGIWLPDPQRAEAWPAQLPLAPVARSFMEKFDAASHDPTSFCMPLGTPRNMLQTQYPLQILQTPQRLTMVLQPDLSNAEVRRIPLGGALPAAPEPSWFGTSRGRWSGPTLVIETIGLRDDSLVSGEGLPHSTELRVIERLSLVKDPRHGVVLVDDMELHDPAAYLEPLRTRRYFVRAPQARLTEGSCVARKWIDKLWRDRLQEHASGARAAGGTR